MAKQAALSVRILESIKKDIDKAAAKEHRSTASLVEKILDDYLQAAKTGSARKYSDSNEYKGDPMEMLTPFGKTLGETTKEELKASGGARTDWAVLC